MGNGMNKILPGLYVGNVRDAKDGNKLTEHGITHILSIHDHAKPIHVDKYYLCITASDTPTQSLQEHFSKCIDFIHQARTDNGAVLVHCIAGVSRSVTVTVAYIMTLTGLGWRDSLNAVRGARRCANPNFGFQRQLLAFEHERLLEEKERFVKKHGQAAEGDLELVKQNLALHMEWVLHGDESQPDTYPLPHKAYGDRIESAEKCEKSKSEDGAQHKNTTTAVPQSKSTSGENVQPQALDTKSNRKVQITSESDVLSQEEIDYFFKV